MNYDDPTWRLVDVYLWTILEDSVGIMSACLPTLRECKISKVFQLNLELNPPKVHSSKVSFLLGRMPDILLEN